ncbi:MAG TPA: tRNA (adenosine(37)-N6)-dimethylallyltransferase MiaA [bacterium]|nr:tRNA (adenosine(37)-N6)-dimethylallyltransferase MiaA [bacterium]HPN35183.1 tRNA (adenosine(37)-N6)-dimethylallyltransferase MiaA [bacterium]
MSAPRVFFLIGPTAVGKTELSLELASRFSADIVSADSRQIYRYMDIGTAKPTPKERSRVPHHFIDIRDPDEPYSAGEFGRAARQCIADLLRRGRGVWVVGGSGFYLQALVAGLFAPQVSDPLVKEKWRQAIREQGREAVYAYLQRVDPETHDRLHINDTQRIVRALEVYELSGRPISHFRSGEEQPADFTPLYIGLDRPRSSLYQRIESRVDRMLESGLLEEVRGLQERGWDARLNALRTVGYKEVFSYFDGRIDYTRMVQLIKQNSRRYAKRQETWFRKIPDVTWFDLEQSGIEEIAEFAQRHG